MTYRVPLEFITRVNGSYNDGGTTYKFNLGLKVFMDAHQPVTLKEGDRYPLGPPSFESVSK